MYNKTYTSHDNFILKQTAIVTSTTNVFVNELQ